MPIQSTGVVMSLIGFTRMMGTGLPLNSRNRRAGEED
jgi:hypothetical protein